LTSDKTLDSVSRAKRKKSGRKQGKKGGKFGKRWARKCQKQIESQLPAAETPKEVKTKQKINKPRKFWLIKTSIPCLGGLYGLYIAVSHPL